MPSRTNSVPFLWNPITAVAAMCAVAQLQVRQMLGQGRLLGLAAVLGLPVLLSVVISLTERSVTDVDSRLALVWLFLLYPQLLCELLALLYPATAIQSEIEWQSLSYLFTRPVPRWRILLAKYATSILVLSGPLSLSLAASWLFLCGDEPELLWGAWLASLSSLATYGAIFLFLGCLVPSRAMVFGLAYAFIEFVISFVPAALNVFSTTYYLRSIAVRAAQINLPNEAKPIIGDATFGQAALALAAMALVALGAACATVTLREYSTTRGET